MGDERIANRELDCCANILGCEHEYTRPQLLSGYVRETRITLAGPLLSSHSLAERMDTSFPMRQFTCDSFGLGFVCCPKAWPNTLVENQRLEVITSSDPGMQTPPTAWKLPYFQVNQELSANAHARPASATFQTTSCAAIKIASTSATSQVLFL